MATAELAPDVALEAVFPSSVLATSRLAVGAGQPQHIRLAFVV